MGRGVVYYMIARAVFLLSSYALYITMAYYLTNPRDYGTVGVIISMMTLARIFLSSGMYETTSRFIAQQGEHTDAIFRKALKIQVIFAAIITVVYAGGAPLWTVLLNDPSLTGYILWSALFIPLMGILQIYLAYLNGKRRFGLHAFFIGFYSVGRFAIAFILVLLGMKIFGIILGFIAAAFITLILALFSTGMKKKGEYDSRSLIQFGIPVILFSLGISSLLNLDILFLKHFYPDSPMVGYYTASMTLGKTPYFLFYAFSLTVLPSVAGALGEDNYEKARSLVSRNLSWLLLLSIPLSVTVLATAEKFLDFVYPSEYVHASGSLSILIFSMSVLAVLYSLTSILTAAGRPKISMIIIFLCLSIQIGLNLVLIPRYQMNGAALSHLITVCVGVLISGFFVFQYFGTLFDINRIIKSVLASFIIYCLLVYFHSYPVQILPLVYGLSFMLFLIIMRLIGGITRDDMASVKRAVLR